MTEAEKSGLTPAAIYLFFSPYKDLYLGKDKYIRRKNLSLRQL